MSNNEYRMSNVEGRNSIYNVTVDYCGFFVGSQVPARRPEIARKSCVVLKETSTAFYARFQKTKMLRFLVLTAAIESSIRMGPRSASTGKRRIGNHIGSPARRIDERPVFIGDWMA